MKWLSAGARDQQRAGRLSLAAALIWPLQAYAVAAALGAALHGQLSHPAFYAVAFGLLGALRSGLGLWSERYSDRAAERVTREARQRIVTSEAMREADSPFGGAGAVSALAGQKVAAMAPFLKRYAPAKTRSMVVPLVILALAAWQSWAVGVILLVAGPLIPVFMALVGMAAKEASEKQMVEIGSLNDLLVERLSALVDIRLLGAREAVLAGFTRQAGDLRGRTMAVLRVAFLSSTVLELFAAIGVAMVAVFVGFSLLGAIGFGTWGAPMTPTAGIFLLLLAPEFFQPLRDLSAAWHDKAAAEAVIAELEAWDAIETQHLLGTGGKVAPLDGHATIALQGCVLPSGLRLPDMEIAAGETVALMGPSGAGKTSALRMMAGLLTPLEGQALVAGHVLKADTADAWRARLGWMPQAPHFLNESIRANLAPRSQSELVKALEAAAMTGVIARLPQGARTRLGETGGGLSGGEARRLTLARAICGAPDVILADEPTADLDAETAAQVAKGLLAQAARGATVVIATHDEALAARMDRIILIGGAP